ncbi:C-GCAxxG-C-C family (seleno)protein [Candidatus Margulisiibacteriota bacterium]
MAKNKAGKHFLGQDGHKRLNCAEAIIEAFKGKLSTDEQALLCKGGGRSPEGLCGAYCSAKHLLQKNCPDKVKEFTKSFIEQAGSLNCQEIRSGKKLSCLGCVEKAAEFVETTCANASKSAKSS